MTVHMILVLEQQATQIFRHNILLPYVYFSRKQCQHIWNWDREVECDKGYKSSIKERYRVL